MAETMAETMHDAEIENWFRYHRPTEDQQRRYVEIRDQAKVMAKLMVKHVPACADRTAALRDLRRLVMAINMAIACNEPDADALADPRRV